MLEMKYIFKQEKMIPQLMFNPGLTLTGFRTTQPSPPGSSNTGTLRFIDFQSSLTNLIGWEYRRYTGGKKHNSQAVVFFQLTIIPLARVGYEMIDSNEARSAEFSIIISYPTSASGIIVLFKTPP